MDFTELEVVLVGIGIGKGAWLTYKRMEVVVIGKEETKSTEEENCRHMA